MSNTAMSLIQAVQANGGRLRVEDGFLVIAPRSAAEPVMEELRKHKTEIIALIGRPNFSSPGAAGEMPDDPAPWAEDFAQWVVSVRIDGSSLVISQSWTDGARDASKKKNSGKRGKHDASKSKTQ